LPPRITIPCIIVSGFVLAGEAGVTGMSRIGFRSRVAADSEKTQLA